MTDKSSTVSPAPLETLPSSLVSDLVQRGSLPTLEVWIVAVSK